MRFVRDVPPEEQREIRWSTWDEAERLVGYDDTRALVRKARELSPST